MPGTAEYQIPNDLAALSTLAQQAEEFLDAQGVATSQVYAANLVIEELVTNTIKYGYDDGTRHQIGIRLDVAPDAVDVVIRDDGHEFDPLKAPQPALEVAIEDRPIGGLGLHLIRRLAKSVTYERRAGENIVAVRLART